MSPQAAAVTAALYKEYFASAEMNLTGMSSHWREYTQESSVGVDREGIPVSAVGIGFGDMNVRRPGDRLFTAAATVLHGLRHPAKREAIAAIRLTLRTTRAANLIFNQDALRQALTLALLSEHLPGVQLRRVLMIGDGYGLLGALIRRRYPGAQVVFMDIGRSLLFQAMTCGRVFPSARHHLFAGADDLSFLESADFVYCPADRVDRWPTCPIDLAINIASMQEMSADVVAAYFRLMRAAPTDWFYCCNRAHKTLPGGEVSEFSAYPWDSRDHHLVEGKCPWHQWYLAARRSSGVLPVALRIPYDGAHLHRLTRLAPSQESV